MRIMILWYICINVNKLYFMYACLCKCDDTQKNMSVYGLQFTPNVNKLKK